MNLPLSPHALLVAAIALLVVWRVLRRVRRLVGRQRVVVRRLMWTAIVFPLLLVAVSIPNVANAGFVEAIVAGVVAGIALALLGLKLTRFEAAPDGRFYVPNTVLGVAISLLFIGRLVYRFGAMYLVAGRFDPASFQSFGRSPLTLALFGVVAAYFATYSIGILMWNRRMSSDAPPRPGAETPLA